MPPFRSRAARPPPEEAGSPAASDPSLSDADSPKRDGGGDWQPATDSPDACACICGPAFPGATRRSCADFARATRSQQSIIIACGVACFWVAIPLYVLSFRAFVYGLCIGSLVFSVGLVYDVLMIGETARAAEEARAFSPALGEALSARNGWRWWAFALNMVGTVLTVAGCLLYLEAVPAYYATSPRVVLGAVPTLPREAVRDVWRGNAAFGASLLVFMTGFGVLAADAVQTMRDVAAATGAPPPGATDETTLMLAGFFASLGLLGVANGALLSSAPWAQPLAGCAGLAGTVSITFFTGWQLRAQWRAFRQGAGGFWDPVALEEAALKAAGGNGAGGDGRKQRRVRWGLGSGVGRGSDGDASASVRTPLLGASDGGGGALPRRGLLACCFGRGGGPTAAEDA